jgi:ABC-2 type transport system permease protein
MQLFIVSSLVCGLYLLDCLYAERKDRSILFWKSLPVSDLQTVVSKFLVAMVIVPLGVFVLASVMYPILFAIASAGVPNFTYISGGWNTGEWLSAEAGMLGALVATQLWYAPVGAWSMLASVMSRRSPALIAILPIVVVTICETLLFRTRHVLAFVGRRLMPVSDLFEALQRPSMWIGLAVTAGMLYIIIRLRRYRDDT